MCPRMLIACALGPKKMLKVAPYKYFKHKYHVDLPFALKSPSLVCVASFNLEVRQRTSNRLTHFNTCNFECAGFRLQQLLNMLAGISSKLVKAYL